MFDLEGARKEGYSDDEIADYLGQQHSYDVSGARKEGYMPSEIINHLMASEQPKDGFLKRTGREVLGAAQAVRGLTDPAGALVAQATGFGTAERGGGDTLGEALYGGTQYGVGGIKESVGIGAEMIGKRLRDPKGMAKSILQGKGGQWISDSFGQLLESMGEKIRPAAAAQQERFKSPYEGRDLWKEPELAVDPRWLARSVGETGPSIMASVLPGMGAAKGVQIAGKTLKWTPQLIDKLAKAGMMITGGAAGGGLEGTGTYKEALRLGMSEPEAFDAATKMGFASAALNAISLGKMFQGNPAKASAWRKLVNWVTSGGTEALTEAAEEPAEAVILGQDVVEAMKRGVNVMPASFLLGMGGSAAASMMGGEQAEAQPDIDFGTLGIPEAEAFTPAPPGSGADITPERTGEPPAPPIERRGQALVDTGGAVYGGPERRAVKPLAPSSKAEEIGNRMALAEQQADTERAQAEAEALRQQEATAAWHKRNVDASAKLKPGDTYFDKKKNRTLTVTDVSGKDWIKMQSPDGEAVEIHREVLDPGKVNKPAPIEHEGEPATKEESKDILRTTEPPSKQQKAGLLSQIDEHIKNAPDTSSDIKEITAEIERARKRDSAASVRSAEGKLAEIKRDMVEIEVPGDGTFSVFNDKNALLTFKRLVERHFPSKPGIQESKPYPTPWGSVKKVRRTAPVSIEQPTPTGTTAAAEKGGYADRPRRDLKAIDLPEIVELAKEINEGKTPSIVKRLRDKLGVFRAAGGQGDILLRADVFLGEKVRAARVKLKAGTELQEVLDDFKARVKEETGLSDKELSIKHERDRQTGEMQLTAYRKDPDLAAKIAAHEIGHLADWLPDKDMSRGNILGRIASLNKYLKGMIEGSPAQEGRVFTKEDRKDLYRQATINIKGKGWHWSKDKTAEERSASSKQINAEFKRLAEEERKDRGLIRRDEAMKELKALTQMWKPFDEEANDNYTKYRYSGKELYADAVSVMLNEPELMRKVAPTFTTAWQNYLERKPEVKSVYDDIQDRILHPERVQEKRLDAIYDMWKRGDISREEMNSRLEGTLKSAKDTVLHWLVDKNQEALSIIRKQEKAGIEKGRTARLALEETAYIASRVQDYLLGLKVKILDPMQQAGLTEKDLSTYLLLKRITDERTEIANPLGHTPKTAREALEALKGRLGDKKFKVVESILSDYRTIRENEVYPEVEASGLWTPELAELVKGRKAYAKFSVTKWFDQKFGKGTSAKVFKQVGTWNEIESPFLATVMQDMSFLRAAKVNTSKQEMLASLKQAGAVTDAQMKWSRDVGGRVPLDPKDPKQGLFTVMENGKPKHYYVSKPIAETFDVAPFEATKIAAAWQAMNRPIRDILVSKNPLWMTRNVLRDMLGTIKNNPEISLRDGFKVLKYYGKALPEVWRDVMRGERSADIAEAARAGATVASRHYSAREMNEATELERIAADFQLDFKEHDEAVTLLKRVKDAYNWLDKMGRVSEQWSKMAGYKYLKNETTLSERERAHRVRTRIGTPDVKRQGSLHMLTNNIFLFSNVNKEGMRSMIEAFNEDRSAYVWKTIATNILPKLLILGAIAGSDDLRKIFDAIGDYDKRMYTIIPLGLKENGKARYLRIPQDYEGQTFGALAWDMAHGKVRGTASDLMQVSPYSWNPLIEVGQDLYSYYIGGMNPYDDYRGRPIIPRLAFEAGGSEANKAMAKHAWRSLGGGALYYPPYDELVKEEEATTKLLRTFPLSIFAQFYKESDQGIKERASETAEEVRQERSGRAIDVQKAIKQSINAQKGQLSRPEISKVYGELVESGVIDPRTRTIKQFANQYQRIQSGVKANPRIDAMHRAQSNEEKAAILLRYKEEMTRREYDALVSQLVADGAISNAVKYYMKKQMKEAR